MTGVTTPFYRRGGAQLRRLPQAPEGAVRGRHAGDRAWAGPCEAAAPSDVGRKGLGLPVSHRPPAFSAVSPLKRLSDV